MKKNRKLEKKIKKDQEQRSRELDKRADRLWKAIKKNKRIIIDKDHDKPIYTDLDK